MLTGRLLCIAALAGTVLLLSGCEAQRGGAVIDAFPPGSMAAPWILQDDVWVGSFELAANALGEDAAAWAEYDPNRVWLAIYCHQDDREGCLTVRGFQFASADAARRAYEAFAPIDADPLEAGDAGCWTDIGVMFRWGRLVFEVFGREATWANQVRSSFLTAYLTKRMPKGAVDVE